MIEDVPVVDAVLHGFDWRLSTTGRQAGFMHQLGHVGFSGRGPQYEKYILSAEQYEKAWQAEDLYAAVFEESQVDIGVYHHIRGMGRGARASDAPETSPFSVGVKLRDLAPGRVFLYTNLVNQFDPVRAKDEIDEIWEKHGPVGLKFYPHEWDVHTGKLSGFRFDDEKTVFPIIEHAVKRGIKVIGIHKAMGALISLYGVADLERAALAFPEMHFEIVHAGFSFMEDTLRIASLPNIYLNLENTSGLALAAPERFAHVMGQFLFSSLDSPVADDRIIWATGCALIHPQMALDAFWNFEMPERLQEAYGYPPLTREVKRKILGENWAHMAGIDLARTVADIPLDETRRRQLAGDLNEPWSKARAAA